MSEANSHHVRRTFSQLIAGHEKGDLDNDLSIAVNEAVAELEAQYQEHRGKPKSTIGVTLTLVKDKNGITISAATARKLPTPPRAAQLYFTTDKNQLTTRDPSQPELPLRDATAAPREVKDA